MSDTADESARAVEQGSSVVTAAAPLTYARETQSGPLHVVLTVWLVYSAIAAAKHLAYWIAVGLTLPRAFQDADFAFVLVECIGYAIGWIGVGAPSLRQRVTMVQASAAVAAAAIAITGVMHLWSYERTAFGAALNPTRPPVAEAIRGVWSLLSNVQYAVVPVVVFVHLTVQRRLLKRLDGEAA